MTSLSLLGEPQDAPQLMSVHRDSGMLSHRVSSNFTSNFTSRISSVAGVATEVARDMQAAVNTAEFDGGDATRLADAHTAARSSHASSMSALVRAPVRRCNQYADNIELFLTSDEWGPISDSSQHWSVAHNAWKTVCRRVGLFLPGERTRTRMRELTMAASGRWPNRPRRCLCQGIDQY
jgi:hypothetical protein